MTPVALPLTIPLDPPLVHGGKTWTEIVVEREPNVGDLAAMDAFSGEVMKSVALISSLAGIPVPALKTMPARQFAVVGGRLESLVGNGLGATAGPT